MVEDLLLKQKEPIGQYFGFKLNVNRERTNINEGNRVGVLTEKL